ncbi:helix-turn-helix domain-containing protein [Phormidesmis sp. 146-33]
MTRTFDAQSYAELLVRYQPKPIMTEAENDHAIALAQELEHRSTRSEEETFLELLITLIEKFEAEHYPIPAGTTGSMLGHLMEARDLEEADLIPVLGTQEKIAEILTDKRTIELDEARKLAKFFGLIWIYC